MPTHSAHLQAWAFFGACLIGLFCAAGPVRASDYRQGFDDERPSWIVHFEKSHARLVRQSRSSEHRVKGERAESIVLETNTQRKPAQFEHQLPAARAIQDLNLSVWFRCPHPKAGLWLRVVFPKETDPRTGNVLTTFLRGDTYEKAGEWQKLSCSPSPKSLQERARQLRATLGNPRLNFDEAYVDRAIVTCQIPVGSTTFHFDELEFGPIVAPADVGTKPGTEIEQTRHSEEDLPATDFGAEKSTAPRVEFQLDRLLVNGRPFFPRIAAHHAEPLDSLTLSGLNVIWVQDYEDSATLQALRRNGLWAMATPPRAVTDAGKIINPEDVSIIPFADRTEPILLWNLGTRVPPEARDELTGWIKQIRAADRDFRRPVVVDIVGGQERYISRDVSMLGLSRHINQTTVAPKTFRNWLIQKKKLARPGTFLWTWIQTEPSAESKSLRQASGQTPVVIEPEQIRLQVYAALAAGCRGIGYWKTESLESRRPGAFERQLAIAQLNLELELLEPFLATGTVVGHVPFGAVAPTPERISRRDIDFRDTRPEVGEREALLRERENQAKRAAGMAGDLEATIIRSDHGTLLLPIWYDRDAQFVPGQMAANDANIVVPLYDLSASAWEVSPTGIRSLPTKRMTGGKRITLKKFDQTAAVIITSDRDLIAQLKKKQETLAEPSARFSVGLAKEKLERVTNVDAELATLGVNQPDAPQILFRSRELVKRAEDALLNRNYDGARQMANDAMQLQRILQKAHWYDAVRKLSSPVSSPHAISFQTLPDHWRLVAKLGQSRMDNNVNLLRSGNFEDIDTMVVERWQHSQKTIPGIRAAAELYPQAKEGRYALRLVAAPVPGQEIPAILPRKPVTVTTPPVSVEAGQLVSVTGWVRVTSPITHTLDGAILYDNLGGPVSALRWQSPSDWQPFSLIREVRQSGSFTITMSLGGIGEIQFDDLKIIPHDPQDAPALTTPTTDPRSPFASPLRLLQQFPQFRPWSSRN